MFNKILSSIENNIASNPIVVTEALKRYSLLQSKLSNWSAMNTLYFAVQAKRYSINLSDVKTHHDWTTTETDSGETIRTYPDAANPIYSLVETKNPNGEIIYQEMRVYDLSQTDGKYLNTLPSSNSIDLSNDKDRLESVLDTIIQECENNGYNINPFNAKFEYNNIEKQIQLNFNESIETRLHYLVSRVVFHEIEGGYMADANELYKYSLKSVCENEVELASYGIMQRLGIESVNDFDSRILGKKLKESLDNVREGISVFNKISNLDDITKMHYYEIKDIEDSIKAENEKNADAVSKKVKDKMAPEKKFKKNYQTVNTAKEDYKRSGKKRIDFIKLSDEEIKDLKMKTKASILEENPVSILSDLVSANEDDYKSGKYWFKRRGEDTKSAAMGLHNGVWIWTDFGDGNKSGTIIDLAMEVGRLDYIEAIAYCLDKLGLDDKVQEAFDTVKYQNEMLKREHWGNDYNINEKFENYKGSKSINEIKEKAEKHSKELKKANEELEKKTNMNSRVTFVTRTIPDKYIKMLKDRGINQLPSNMYFIKGQIFGFKEDGESRWFSEKEGVGVLSSSVENQPLLDEIYNEINQKGFVELNENIDEEDGIKIGADVHFPKIIDKKGNVRKTQTFGPGETTFLNYNHEKNTKVAIFESKMDWASADEEFKFKENNIDVILANTTGNAPEVAELIKRGNYEEVINFNQFDIPAVKFAAEIMNAAKYQEHTMFQYSDNEYKEDINDIRAKGISLSSRQIKGDMNTYYKQLNQFESHINTSFKDKDENKKARSLKDLQKVRLLLEELSDNIKEKQIEDNVSDFANEPIVTVQKNVRPSYFDY